MSHNEQREYFRIVTAGNRPLVDGGRILEVGSYDVNGSIRGMCSSAGSYLGVDLEEGPGVDLVKHGHKVDLPDGSFDVTFSGECFEHDPHWKDTFHNMIRLTRPGGLVAFSCASRGRPEHGTTRTRPDESPGTIALGSEYYRNLVSADVEKLRLSDYFDEYSLWYIPTSFDLYFAGRRRGKDEGGKPAAVVPPMAIRDELLRLMPVKDRLIRLPLRFVSLLLPEKHYQLVAIPYWKVLLRSLKIAGRLRRLLTSPT